MSIATSISIPTILFAAFATVSLAGCALTVAVDGDTTKRTEHDSVPAAGIARLEVDTDNGAIDIRGGAVDEVTIQSVLREQHDGDADATVEIDGDRLVIVGECDHRWWDACSVGFVVTVPAEFDVRVSTGSGRVETKGIVGDVNIETDNGAIEATELGGGTVVTKSSNGRIRLTFDTAPGSVRADTHNGAVSVELPDDGDGYAVDADSDNGHVDVTVDTDPVAERQVVAQSGNGSIEIGYRTT